MRQRELADFPLRALYSITQFLHLHENTFTTAVNPAYLHSANPYFCFETNYYQQVFDL
jgi:hypothetical protein